MIKNNIEEKFGSQIILYGLLHDIGHIFFSHLGESILNTLDRFNHENYGLILQEKHLEPVLNKSRFYIPKFGLIPNEHKVLIKSHFDIDTIQGILKTAEILNLNVPDIEDLIEHVSYSIKAKIWNIDEKSSNFLLDFWNLKSNIYKDYVYGLKNQYIQFIITKYASRIANLNKNFSEDEIESILFKNKNFHDDFLSLKDINQINSFYINFKQTSIDQKKGNILEIFKKLKIENFNIIRVKYFNAPDSDMKNIIDLKDLEFYMANIYEEHYRIYFFLTNEEDFKEKINNEINKL